MSVNEKYLNKYPKSISIEIIEIILKQMRNSICKICLKNGIKGTGFLCKIPLTEKKILKVLITNNHIIDQEYLSAEKTINAIFDNNKIKKIKLKNKKWYTNKDYDITIIEIKEEDEEEIKEDCFLEIDDIKIDQSYYGYIGNTIYILHYPSIGNEQKLSMSLGILKENSFEKNYEFNHLCSTDSGSSGSPIINSSNNKVIGIHKMGKINENYNVGAYLNYAIENYKDLFKKELMKKNYLKNENIINNEKNVNNLNKSINENKIKYEKNVNNLNKSINENKIKYEKNVNNLNKSINENKIKYENNIKYVNNLNKSINENNIKYKLINENNVNNINNLNNLNKLKNGKNITNEKNTNNLNNVKIKYKINKNNKIKIFGDDFVKNNKNNCSFIFNGKEKELDTYLKLDSNEISSNYIEITLKRAKNITNMSYIFSGCDSLSSTSDFSNWNTFNVTNMSYMFFGCEFLEELPNISYFNTNNVKDMSFMFSGCKHLKKIPDISSWNTSNVTNMSNMFSYCSSLKFLPENISKWNINRVNDLKCMLYQCSSLEYLPDISLWNVNNVRDMSYMFYYCKSLLKLPELERWNIDKSTRISDMFYGCSIFLNVPKKLQKY